MAAQTPQSFANHARLIPGYHIVTFGLLAVTLLWSAWRAATDFSVDRLMMVALALAVLLISFYARVFALTVQDRVIRLEMRLRLAQLLPPDLRGRIVELTPRQLVGLRFAGDAELPDLVRRVLTDGIRDVSAIKRLVRDWQPDYLRA
jgi:uncharacterized protein DUF6526